MALSQDVLTRIINVHWGGGGIFIAGDMDSNIYRLNIEDETPAWRELGKLDFHKENEDGYFSGRVAGSAYAVADIKDEENNTIGTKPVFVLVGGSGFANEFGVIMASRDGLNWSRVFTIGPNPDSGTYIGAGIFGVVWDEKERKFYAGGHQVDNFIDGEADLKWEEQTDFLFQSSDGFKWSKVSQHVIHVEASLSAELSYPDYKTGLLAGHCSKLVKDDNGNGIPDGNYGYKSETILIAPSKVIKIDYLFGLYLNDIPRGSTTVTVTNFGEGVPPSYPSDVGIPIACTATAGGKWMAAGGVLGSNFDAGTGRSQAAMLVPSEAGDEYVWKAINPAGTNMIITMTGGTTKTNAGL